MPRINSTLHSCRCVERERDKVRESQREPERKSMCECPRNNEHTRKHVDANVKCLKINY